MLILLCVLCVVYGLWTWRLRRSRSPHDPPYYPGVYPIIGHTYILSSGTKETYSLMLRVSKECSKKGGVIRVNLGLQSYYAITDPEDALTAANGCLTKHFAYDWGKPWLGNGLVTASGPNWKRHRQMIVPAFSLPILHGFVGVFNSQAKTVVKNLSSKAGTGRFNILPVLMESNFKTICMTAFGIDPLDDKDFIKQYTQSVDTILGLMVMKFYNLLLHSDFVCRLVGWKQKEDEIIKLLNNMSDLIIKKKRAAMNKEKSRRRRNQEGIMDSPNLKGQNYKSLLDLLLELSENNALSDKEIREEVDTFIVAGYDTSALVVTYTLTNLGTYPEIQERVYQEIKSVTGGTDRDLEKIDYAQLVYTEAVIKETLRVNPIVPVLLRYADKDVQLKKYKIRAGSNVALLIYGMHRDQVWGPDADEFRPERWLNLDPRQNRASGSFSLGKRSCIGQHFALMSLKTTLSHILREYRIRANISELKFKVDFMLKPVGGCHVILERRNTV